MCICADREIFAVKKLFASRLGVEKLFRAIPTMWLEAEYVNTGISFLLKAHGRLISRLWYKIRGLI